MFDNTRYAILPAARQKKLELIVDIDPRVPDRILGDIIRLRQVMLNLLNNAVKVFLLLFCFCFCLFCLPLFFFYFIYFLLIVMYSLLIRGILHSRLLLPRSSQAKLGSLSLPYTYVLREKRGKMRKKKRKRGKRITKEKNKLMMY